jgi:hypothetical protein
MHKVIYRDFTVIKRSWNKAKIIPNFLFGKVQQKVKISLCSISDFWYLTFKTPNINAAKLRGVVTKVSINSFSSPHIPSFINNELSVRFHSQKKLQVAVENTPIY